MKPAEAAQVLAKCACFDPMFSKPSEALSRGWAEAFTRYGIELKDALEAVTAHYVESADRAMPAPLIAQARKLRRDRAERDDADARAIREAKIDAKIAAGFHRPAVTGAQSRHEPTGPTRMLGGEK
ncbi:hypothetical protein [Tomitella fengzijianii]|uniref:Uncharacterized protein n=1 Tax=Tomitella fengzijianii TaxID=2597660 RepID=A0A516X5K7_9ACTN|nr:hypothetical protein [Tomitella fengzijianii]QDQ97961.1 hypothetical protein FO059_12360 [Tomitella fengzijianii]